MLGSVFVASSSGFAAIDITKSPFTNPELSGPVDEINLVGTDKWQEDSLANVINWFVNRVLGIMALIALIVVLWWWFRMVTAAGNEDQYKSGFTILKQAAIGLVLIGLAWFIVSGILRLINLSAVWAKDTGWSTIVWYDTNTFDSLI